MIRTDFNWTEPLNLMLVVAVLGLLLLQCGLLYARHRHSGRFGIRATLNAVLWLSVVVWMLDPYFKMGNTSKTGLLVADNVPSVIAGHMRDSLAAADMIPVDEIADRPVDTLVIAGQEFDDAVFKSIRQFQNLPVLHWKPWFAQNTLSGLHWKGILRKGEMQRIDGHIHATGKKTLQIRYAGQTLDSVILNAGRNNFRLTFPAFSEGRTTTTLHLDGEAIDTLRFFAQPEQKLTIRFLLDNPDFETRNLATWLGKQGHAVLYESLLSKNIRTRLTINRAAEPDLLVTTASNAADATVKKAVNAGKSVLFIQLGDPATELRAINNALDTRFQAMKIANEESVAVSNSLTALPFRFELHSLQVRAPHYPVATEEMTGKVAVSLLNETFPMQLSGDSIAYGKIWNEILAYVRPPQGGLIECGAPVFQNVPAEMHLNNFLPVRQFLTIGQDTVSTTTSALNDRSAVAHFLPVRSGWQSLHDSAGTELYVQNYSALRYASRMQHFIQSTQKNTPNPNPKGEAVPTKKLPGWAWFSWLMLCLAAVWIEPKL
ncbi:MAG: hypothetical protein J7619_03055 [Dyadobacter sp.]|uniref:hypothetical protein n=1 Tax=Dyadobacter sp. TaxID=1914288 RepID=UPI001B069EDB|nr:hypothetical protein [Dyadobacter sp.]MBO9611644.1 hypothetical protein [Dyadobacter sp.]